MKHTFAKVSIMILTMTMVACNQKSGKENMETETVKTTERKTSTEENALTDKIWKLTKLMGKPVAELDKSASNVFITFATEENRVGGNSGCNSFGGTYTLLEGNRFKLSKLASTMKACMNMEVEQQFMDVLQKSDTYIIKDGTLTITKARMAPLAEFELSEE
ncbi:META domain-containing protein [Galbibacter sp. PAP.153]|uniref:META domain-containing protein n=1 Tax=Galbibacter sp. PAP.153 TaxID=3104623 RepID=UPI003008848D